MDRLDPVRQVQIANRARLLLDDGRVVTYAYAKAALDVGEVDYDDLRGMWLEDTKGNQTHRYYLV